MDRFGYEHYEIWMFLKKNPCWFGMAAICVTPGNRRGVNTTTFAGLKTAWLAAIWLDKHCRNYGHAINALSFVPAPV